MSTMQEVSVTAESDNHLARPEIELHPSRTTHPERLSRWSIQLSTRMALPLLLCLAFLHGSLYALFLPPWGLIDEAQHLHYIQYIAEERTLPIAGDLYLSDEIVASLFATHRWETFHWTPPASSDPQAMGLEGHSYEAYQPPLFYLLMTPFYWALPQDILVKVYGLRLVVVLLSLISVWALYRSAVSLLPQSPYFPYFAGLVFVAIPERAMATSRINNDILLEVMAALFFVVLTRSAIEGLTRRRTLLLALFLGLAVWVKLSAAILIVPLFLLFWIRRKQPQWRAHLLWFAVAIVPIGFLLVFRNLWLYQDLIGFSAFEKIQMLAAADRSIFGVVNALLNVHNHLWLVWWKGSEAGHNGLLTLFYGMMAAVIILAWGRIFAELWRQRRAGLWNERSSLLVIYFLTAGIYAAAVVNSYFQGMVPVIQGRFMLPAMIPFVLLLAYGLWRYPRGEVIVLGATVALWVMGLISLFGNLVPYYYYWSGVLQGKIAQTLPGIEKLSLLYQRLLLDKPPFVPSLLLLSAICYGVVLLYTIIVTIQLLRDPARWWTQGGQLPTHLDKR